MSSKIPQYTRFSPMLDRLRETRAPGRFSVPKRGRIRAVLVIAIVTLTILVLRNKREENRDVVTLAPPTASIAVGSPAVKAKPRFSFFQRKPRPPAPLKSASGGLDVAALLKRHPPRLSHERDTVSDDGRDYVVHYSLDTALQKYCRILLQRYHPLYGAVVAIDPATGAVRALVSYINEGEPYLGKDLYCRNLFPAASIFKTVTAAGAIEKGKLNSESMLKQVGRNHTLYRFQLEEELKNYREVSLVDAYAYSINPVFGRMGLYILEADGMAKYAEKFGFGQPIPFELETDEARFVPPDTQHTLAELASGFNQQTRISPLFGALIASAVAENGAMPRPTLVDSVTVFGTGARIYRKEPGTWRTAIKAETARELKEMMGAVARYGTARKSFRTLRHTSAFDAFEYGGKTGNIDHDSIGRVDWFVGFARDPRDSGNRLAVGIVTVHGPNWTVHSSYLGAELCRSYLRSKIRETRQRTDIVHAREEEEAQIHEGG